MTTVSEIYKCEACGNIIEVVHSGGGDLKCCERPMIKMEEKSGPEGQEKHLPVVENNGNNITVKVGSIPHPMENEHFIEWVELVTDKGVKRISLAPGQEPVAKFTVENGENIVKSRAFCNIHELWAV